MSIKTVIYLGLRPFIPKKHGIKGVVTHTILVVAIAMLPLVVVLMVADGMIQGITSRFIETSSYHFRVYSRQSSDVLNLDVYNETRDNILKIPSITVSEVERTAAGVGVVGDIRRGIEVRGINPEMLLKDKYMSKYLEVVSGSFDVSDNNSIVISSYLARQMHVNIGDDFRVITGKILKSGKILPRITKLKVTGVIKTGYEELDKLWVFISTDLSKKILPSNSSETFIGIKCTNPYGNLNQEYLDIKQALPSGWIIRKWSQINRNAYENFNTTKMVLTLIMGLIVVVAGINISSSLIMLVLEKRRDIAILKSMGLSPGEVMGSYILTGIIIGVIGTILGVILGLLITLNINQIVFFFENIINSISHLIQMLFHLEQDKNFIFLDSEYYLENIPVELNFRKLLFMTFFSITTTALASYFPARKAGLIKPLKIMQKF
ncbi:MAG: FtsX-like permease family protein [Spirochaetaceae bacterium]